MFLANKPFCNKFCTCHSLADLSLIGHPQGMNPEQGDGAVEVDSLRGWIEGKIPSRGLGTKSAAVLATVLSQPARASYGTVQEVASLSGVNVATVTRTAQTLGYGGWPVFQREVRARYLSHLSASEVADQHADISSPASTSLRQDLDSLAVLIRQLDLKQLDAVAVAIATARRTYIVSDGSYGALAMAMAHNARLAGYDVEWVIGGASDVANRMAYLDPADMVIVISFWRIYETAVIASKVAHEKGAGLYVITDAITAALERIADGVVIVPAEGVSFFPSMTSGLAAVQAIVARLASINPSKTRQTVAAAESQWQRFSLLHRRTGAGA